MSDDDLAYLSATEALTLFKAKKLSPVEHLDAQIARAAATEPKINAIVADRYDKAMDQARKAEAKYASGARTRALEGLAVAIKDESTLKGERTTNGSLLMRDYVAEATSPMNEHILRAGAIVHARTATPEFSCVPVTHSRLHGVTRNPWNTAMTPAGSSGGSGASLAAGSSALATGSDIGGSIRLPASVNGLYGLKPSYGRNPADAPFNLDPYAVDGPLARRAADMILLQNAMCGPHPRDIATLRPKLRISPTADDIRGWKIAYSPDLGFYRVDPEVRRNTEAALDALRAAGAEVEEVELPWGPELIDGALAHLEHLFGVFIAGMMAEAADQMTGYARRFAESAQSSTARDFFGAIETAAGAYAALGPLLKTRRLLVCPTTALPAVKAEHDCVDDVVEIDGEAVDPLLGWCMTPVFNMLNRCPVVSVPTGRASNGVPTGMQIVGRTYMDADVCRAALAYEREAGAWYADGSRRPDL